MMTLVLQIEPSYKCMQRRYIHFPFDFCRQCIDDILFISQGTIDNKYHVEEFVDSGTFVLLFLTYDKILGENFMCFGHPTLLFSMDLLGLVAKLQALYQVIVLLVLNFRGTSILKLEGDTPERASKEKNTVIFNAFVLCQVYLTFDLLDQILFCKMAICLPMDSRWLRIQQSETVSLRFSKSISIELEFASDSLPLFLCLSFLYLGSIHRINEMEDISKQPHFVFFWCNVLILVHPMGLHVASKVVEIDTEALGVNMPH